MAQIVEPVTGAEDALEVPAALRVLLPDRSPARPVDALAKRIVQLATIHGIDLAVRHEEVADLDDEAKRRLIADVERAIDHARKAPAKP